MICRSVKIVLIVVASVVCPLAAFATQPDAPVTTLKEVTVVGQKEDAPKGGSFMPDVQGTAIYTGKKTSYVDLQDRPKVVNSNLRQTFEKTPGLLVSEESTPLVSIGYRGLAPDRAQFMQVLKDGISFQMDAFGYPEAYYLPPLETIDHIDFVRGGSALMYGPQPGGAINFVTKDPYEGPFTLLSENSVGSHDFFSDYTAVSGTRGALGYNAYFHHRQSQGFRDFNSQYGVYYGGSKLVIESDADSRWEIVLDAYEDQHGEPGGLTRADFDTNASRSTRLMDRFDLDRYSGSVAYKRDISNETHAEVKVFGAYAQRYSERQRGGGFGTLPTGATASTNDIQDQEFFTGGVDARMRHEYEGFIATENTLTAGVFYYHSTSPRTDKRGFAPDASDGQIRKDAERNINNVSVFAENMFRWGKFSVTPGVRLENIWQGVQEEVNLDKTMAPLADESEYDFVPLFGIGTNLELLPAIDLYANVSQSYRPRLFTQFVPVSTNQVVNGDLNEGESWQAETGLRGYPTPYWSWDFSLFHMEFDDQIGTVGSAVENVGDAEHQGVEFFVQFNLCKWLDELNDSHNVEASGSLSVFYDATLLDAKFVAGPNAGNVPQYAPDYLMRGGIEYALRDRVRARLAGTFLGNHFGDDGNTASFNVPSYKIWDLTAETKVYKEFVSLFGGVNNLFGEHYFARVTSAGIDPADGRNYYGGMKLKW